MSEFSYALGADPTTGAIPQKTLDWLTENLPDSGTSGAVTSVNGVEPDPSGNVTIGNITIAAGAGIDVSYNPSTDTYTISATGGDPDPGDPDPGDPDPGDPGGDETLTITNHGDGTVTYSGTSVVVSGDGSEFTVNHPGLVLSGDGLQFTATV